MYTRRCFGSTHGSFSACHTTHTHTPHTRHTPTYTHTHTTHPTHTQPQPQHHTTLKFQIVDDSFRTVTQDSFVSCVRDFDHAENSVRITCNSIPLGAITMTKDDRARREGISQQCSVAGSFTWITRQCRLELGSRCRDCNPR